MKAEDLCIVCGENSHQTGRFEPNDKMIDYELSDNLTYNELISINKGLSLISEFYDVKAICTINKGCICAVALAESTAYATQKVMDSNPVDFMSAIIVSSGEIDSETAKFFKESNIIVAPNYTKNALEYLKTHNIKYVTINTPLKDYKKYYSEKITVTPIGTLIEEANLSELNKDTFKVDSKAKPSVEQIEDAVFAWKVAKHNNSQAIVIAKDLKTTAIAQGLQSASVEFALDYSCEMSKDAILASDMPISVHDVNVASQGRIGVIIIPSASKEIVNLADKYSMVLITTGQTNILH
ncbi:MAG: hypothetical protein MJ237_01270 [bacterium]|nr:hypothetical protein [bacterium]